MCKQTNKYKNMQTSQQANKPASKQVINKPSK